MTTASNHLEVSVVTLFSAQTQNDTVDGQQG